MTSGRGEPTFHSVAGEVFSEEVSLEMKSKAWKQPFCGNSEERKKPRERRRRRGWRGESCGCLRELALFLEWFTLRSAFPVRQGSMCAFKNTAKRTNVNFNFRKVIHPSIQQILVWCPPRADVALGRFRNTDRSVQSKFSLLGLRGNVGLLRKNRQNKTNTKQKFK